MKIWEAVVYGIAGGICELLPISFSAHVAMLRNAFHMSSISDGGGCFVRAAICLGVVLAVLLSFGSDVRNVGNELGLMLGLRKNRRSARSNPLLQRSVMLYIIALAMMLCSLFFLAAAERIERLLYIIIFALIYAMGLYFCCRGRVGNRTERDVAASDFALIGIVRMLCVFPGMSALGGSIAVGRMRGFSLQYNVRTAYLLTLAYQIVLFFFYLIRGMIFGVYSAAMILPCILATLFSTVFGYLAIQYFRYLLQRVRFYVFAYYTLEIAAVAAVLALINA